MAGIIAISVTKTHTDSGADVATSGFLKNERITLSAVPPGAGRVWSLSAPSASSPASSALDDDQDTNPAFTPDVAGYYTVSVLIDGTTTYVLRISVSPIAVARQAEAINFQPLEDSQVPAPTIGRTVYCSATQGGVLVEKRPDNSVHVINVT